MPLLGEPVAEKPNKTQLQPKEAFYNRLNDTHITDEGYQHAHDVWRVFGMNIFREYHEKYLESDVRLLADVFENFRKDKMKNYGLDAA